MKTLGEGATHIPVRSLWFLLIYASDLLAQLRTKEREAILAGERDDDLIDAIAEVLVVEVERRLCRQLTLRYRSRRADLTRVRGRIDHLRTATRRLSDQGRIACRFDELSVDSPQHRFIAHTLLSAAPHVIRPELAQRCRAAAFRMHRLGVGATPPSRAELSMDRLGHHDVDDRRMRDAAVLLRDLAIPAHEAGPFDLPELSGDARAHRKLFEAAVRGFFRYTLSSLGWEVQARILRWTPPQQSEPPFVPVMKTDVTLDHPASKRRVVIEAKFTDALVDREGKTILAPDYLYQLYAYLASQSGRGDGTLDAAEGVLLFVKTAEREVFDGEVTIQGHRIRFLSVDLTGSPADIRARWMQCIQN
jgi:5-methylcytosine-specific restriction enzyme subunit McrC